MVYLSSNCPLARRPRWTAGSARTQCPDCRESVGWTMRLVVPDGWPAARDPAEGQRFRAVISSRSGLSRSRTCAAARLERDLCDLVLQRGDKQVGGIAVLLVPA